MYLQVSRVRRNGKTYEYARLVESYRRPDGMPTQRVIANLGQLSGLELDNFRAALEASRSRQRVLAERKVPRGHTPARPVQNLRYLDLAVLEELWRAAGLDALLSELMPRGDAEVAPVS